MFTSAYPDAAGLSGFPRVQMFLTDVCVVTVTQASAMPAFRFRRHFLPKYYNSLSAPGHLSSEVVFGTKALLKQNT